jgi:hypothetical protein
LSDLNLKLPSDELGRVWFLLPTLCYLTQLDF